MDFKSLKPKLNTVDLKGFGGDLFSSSYKNLYSDIKSISEKISSMSNKSNLLFYTLKLQQMMKQPSMVAIDAAQILKYNATKEGIKNIINLKKNKVISPGNITQNTINLVEYGLTTLWYVQFGANGKETIGPFNGWVAATSIEDNRTSLQAGSPIATHIGSLNIPVSKGFSSIRINFIDDVQNSILHYLESWIQSSFGYSSSIEDGFDSTKNQKGFYTPTLAEVCKPIIVGCYDRSKRQLERRLYQVFPSGSLTFSGDSGDGALRTISMDFTIANVDSVKIEKLPTNDLGQLSSFSPAKLSPDQFKSKLPAFDFNSVLNPLQSFNLGIFNIL